MERLKFLQDIFEKELVQVKSYLRSASPKGLFEPIAYSLDMGGKRLRPTLALLACELFEKSYEEALDVALALEVFHNFTLLHDDIMDCAEVRRGMPSVCKKYSDNNAILSGDAMLIQAYEHLEKVPVDKLPSILYIFNKTAREVCEGQQYDMEFENRQDVSVEEYLNMIRLKTAVLLAGSLRCGAMIAGANEQDANALYNFGISLGLAFQIQDDLLDVYADINLFGKKTGGDILCNKKTFLMLNALEKAEENDKEELLKWITTESFIAEEKIQAVKTIYDRLNIKDVAENKINEYYEQALTHLESIDGNSVIKNELLEFVELIKNREK